VKRSGLSNSALCDETSMRGTDNSPPGSDFQRLSVVQLRENLEGLKLIQILYPGPSSIGKRTWLGSTPNMTPGVFRQSESGIKASGRLSLIQVCPNRCALQLARRDWRGGGVGFEWGGGGVRGLPTTVSPEFGRSAYLYQLLHSCLMVGLSLKLSRLWTILLKVMCLSSSPYLHFSLSTVAAFHPAARVSVSLMLACSSLKALGFCVLLLTPAL